MLAIKIIALWFLLSLIGPSSCLADRHAIVQAQHHHDDVGLFVGEEPLAAAGPNPRRAGGQLAAMACKGCGRRCLARSSGEQFIADPGTLGESGATRLLERRDLDKHVLPATIRLDESITLGWIKPLHRPHCHVSISLKS